MEHQEKEVRPTLLRRAHFSVEAEFDSEHFSIFDLSLLWEISVFHISEILECNPPSIFILLKIEILRSRSKFLVG